MPTACKVFSQLVFGVFTRFGEVFFPFNNDIAVRNVCITRLGTANTRNIENGFFTALCELVNHIFCGLTVLKKAGQQILKAQFFSLFAVGLAQANQIIGDLFLNFMLHHVFSSFLTNF